MMAHRHIVVVANHSMLLAIPAFVPAVVLAGVVVYIAIKDRRSESESADSKDNSE